MNDREKALEYAKEFLRCFQMCNDENSQIKMEWVVIEMEKALSQPKVDAAFIESMRLAESHENDPDFDKGVVMGRNAAIEEIAARGLIAGQLVEVSYDEYLSFVLCPRADLESLKTQGYKIIKELKDE